MSFPVAFVRRDSFTPLSESRLSTDVPSRRRSSGMTEEKAQSLTARILQSKAADLSPLA